MVSHESALDILGLSDVVPEAVHLTVSPEHGAIVQHPKAIHATTRHLGKSEVVVRDGVRLTAPARAIVDAAGTGTAPERIIAAAGQVLDRAWQPNQSSLPLRKRVEAESSVLFVRLFRRAADDAGRGASPLCARWNLREKASTSLPDRLPHPPADWTIPYRKLAKEAGVGPDLRASYAEAAALLDPVLASHADGR